MMGCITIEQLLAEHRYQDAFNESVPLFQASGDFFYLSTCLHIFSLGTKIDGTEILALIEQHPDPIIRDYCHGVYCATQAAWAEAFLSFRKVYLECRRRTSLMRPEKTLPLCMIDRLSDGQWIFEVVDTTLYAASLYNANSIPLSLLEGEVPRQTLLAHKVYVSGNTDLNVLATTVSRLTEIISALEEEVDVLTAAKKRKPQNRFSMPKGTTWRDIKMTVGYDYEFVTIEVSGVRRKIHYTELGFPRGQGKNPLGELWRRMLKMAIEGYIYAPSPKIKPNPKNNPTLAYDSDTGSPLELTPDDKENKKISGFQVTRKTNIETAYISHIRTTLRNFFGLESDPFCQTAPGRYKPNFKIKYHDNDPGNHDVT
jgi:hypothetical protein